MVRLSLAAAFLRYLTAKSTANSVFFGGKSELYFAATALVRVTAMIMFFIVVFFEKERIFVILRNRTTIITKESDMHE